MITEVYQVTVCRDPERMDAHEVWDVCHAPNRIFLTMADAQAFVQDEANDYTDNAAQDADITWNLEKPGVIAATLTGDTDDAWSAYIHTTQISPHKEA